MSSTSPLRWSNSDVNNVLTIQHPVLLLSGHISGRFTTATQIVMSTLLEGLKLVDRL